MMDVVTKCPMCGTTNVVRVNYEGYTAWRKGALIQDALPKLSPEKREMLVSGICPKCWDNMFAEPDDDECIDLDDESQTRYLDLM